MKTENLQLIGTVAAGFSAPVVQALKAVPGVRDVAVTEGNQRVAVLFDDSRTDLQALREALMDAGFASQRASSHGENGSCCGSCGG